MGLSLGSTIRVAFSVIEIATISHGKNFRGYKRKGKREDGELSMKSLYISIGALIIALFPGLPYGYYQLLRWFVCGSCCYGAYLSHKKHNEFWKWTYISLAVLFNPIAPIRFEKILWQFLDIIAALIILTSIIIFKRQKRDEAGIIYEKREEHEAK